MINLLCVFPDPNDATSFYRGLGPLTHLRQNALRELEIKTIPPVDPWWVYREADCVFMQRPFLPEHQIAFDLAKKSGRKVWIDYDDNYFNVTSDNPTFPIYGQKEVRERIVGFVKDADIVSTTNKSNQEEYLNLNKNTVIIPNAMDEKQFTWRDPKVDRVKTVLWRGTEVHQRGLQKYADAIIGVARDFPGWKWVFLGSNPWNIIDKIPNAQYVPQIPSITNYFTYGKNLGHTVQIVTENENLFTRGKSNIAWMEASFFGAVTVAPDMDGWKMPGCYTYDGDKSFRDSLAYAMTRADVEKESDQAWNYILENLSLDKINGQRKKIIEELIH